MKRKHAKADQKRPRGGVLTVISLLMIGSATLRLGFEAGPALARTVEDAAQSTPRSDRANVQAVDLQAVLDALQRKEVALNAREGVILDKERALAIADQAIAMRLEELRKAEETLRETLAIADKAAERDLVQLTDVYQNMKPKEAAQLFETMDPVFAAGFLSRMPPEAAANVMAGLSPGAAYTVSVVMAGRNALAPQE